MVGVSGEVSTSRMQQLTAGRRSGFRGLLGANRYILCSSLFAVIGSFLYGTDQGVLSNLLTGENFGAHFPKVYSDPVLKGWVVSVLQLGAWLGALLNGPLANKISRKYSLMVAAFVSRDFFRRSLIQEFNAEFSWYSSSLLAVPFAPALRVSAISSLAASLPV